MIHDFADQDLLLEALTHTSFAYENGGPHNERLEFLGDAVLQLYVTEILYETFPQEREGTLHVYRTRLVSTGHLANLAKRWSLNQKVRLGKGEESSGGREKERLLAGTFEAVLGAIHLDAGQEISRQVVRTCIAPDLKELPQLADPRKQLHEWCQRSFGSPPTYTVVDETGPAHAPNFTVHVYAGEQLMGNGEGASKRSASIAAASMAVEKIKVE